MGGKAETSVESLNEAVVNSIMAISKTCAATATNIVDINSGKSTGQVVFSGDVTQDAESSINCQQNTDVEVALRAQMAAAIDAQSKAVKNSIFSGDVGIYSESDTSVKNTNRTVMNTSLSDAMDCVTDATNIVRETSDSNAGFTASGNITQSARARISACVQGSKSLQATVANMATEIKAKATEEGFLASMFDNMQNIVASVMILAFVAAIVGAIAFAVVKAKGAPKKPPPGAMAGSFGLPIVTLGSSLATLSSALPSAMPEQLAAADKALRTAQQAALGL